MKHVLLVCKEKIRNLVLTYIFQIKLEECPHMCISIETHFHY